MRFFDLENLIFVKLLSRPGYRSKKSREGKKIEVSQEFDDFNLFRYNKNSFLSFKIMLFFIDRF